jgi:hypothetical protein
MPAYLITHSGMNNFLFVETDGLPSALASFRDDMEYYGPDDEIEVYEASVDIIKAKGGPISIT